jgi:hypothetical protein
MKKVIRLTEADLEKIVRRVIKEQSTEFDKVGVDEWIYQNKVEFRVFLAPNPYSDGNLKIGVQAMSKGQPIEFPYDDETNKSWYEQEMAGKLSTLVIADQSGKEVYRGKLKFVDMSDSDTTVYDNNATPDKFFKELEPGNEVIEAIQREKQKGVKMLFVNILDTGDEVYNAAMNKYKVKGAKLMLR